MTPKQQSTYRAMWTQICLRRGWTCANGVNTKAQRAKRLEFHQEVFGRPISSSLIVTNADVDKIFDRFRRELDVLGGPATGPGPAAAVEQPRRRDLGGIRNYLACLAVYHPDLDGYLKPLLDRRFKVFKGVSTIEDLSDEPRIVGGVEKASELDMFKWTISGLVQQARKEAGDSGHAMKAKAQVPCDCKWCCGRIPTPVQAAPMEAMREVEPEPELVESNEPF